MSQGRNRGETGVPGKTRVTVAMGVKGATRVTGLTGLTKVAWMTCVTRDRLTKKENLLERKKLDE